MEFEILRCVRQLRKEAQGRTTTDQKVKASHAFQQGALMQRGRNFHWPRVLDSSAVIIDKRVGFS